LEHLVCMTSIEVGSGRDRMRVRLLGSVDVLVRDVPRAVPGLRGKAVLAALALHPGEVVSTERLIHIVWGETTSESTPGALQCQMSRLRRILDGSATIVARSRGYVLDVSGEVSDAQVGERLIRGSGQVADLCRREAMLQVAVELWRGRPLAELVEMAWFDGHAQRLDRLLWQARYTLIETRLNLGQHFQLIADIEELISQNPHHEQVHAQLMLALYRAGRQADALATYQRLRRTLDEDLGIAPSQPLRELEAAILRQDVAIHAPPPPGPAHGSPLSMSAVAVAAQLPAAVTTFTGRHGELARLDSLLDSARSARPPGVVIAAISGAAGIGKTTLAVNWVHRVAIHFPDGQLYVDLRGFGPTGAALEPADVARRFLHALGVAAVQIPADPDARAALYRSRLAGRRVLVVLDNARDSAQVRPLLPGAPTCLVVVTSRRRLTGLVAANGASHVDLDVLTAVEARRLLASRLGVDRVAVESDAVEEIIEYSARLPLALVILAARAATSPGVSLRSLAADLRDSRDRLDCLTTDDPHGDVRAVFSWSYRALSPAAARLFRLLGIHPGPDVSAAAAASLAGTARKTIRSALTELVQASLLVEHKPGRYTFHDLLRTYATELAHNDESDEQRQLTAHRIIDHYMHATEAAMRIGADAAVIPPPSLWYPHQPAIDLETATPGVALETFTDPADTLAWLLAEQQILLASVDLAVGTGLDARTVQLVHSIVPLLRMQESWQEIIAVQDAALAAATRLGDRLQQSHAHWWLGYAHVRLLRLPEARAHLRRSLDLYENVGDICGRGNVYRCFTMICSEEGRYAEAVHHAERALALFTSVGDEVGRARALNAAGWNYAQLGDYRQALTHCTEALALHLKIDDLPGAAATRHSIGYVHYRLGQHTEALRYFEQALAHYRRSGQPQSEAENLTSIGNLHHADGDTGSARKAWAQAFDIFHRLGHPDAAAIRDRLSGLGTTGLEAAEWCGGFLTCRIGPFRCRRA